MLNFFNRTELFNIFLDKNKNIYELTNALLVNINIIFRIFDFGRK